MTPMIDFSVAMLDAIVKFLATEPIIYLYGMILMCFLIKAVRSFWY